MPNMKSEYNQNNKYTTCYRYKKNLKRKDMTKYEFQKKK